MSASGDNQQGSAALGSAIVNLPARLVTSLFWVLLIVQGSILMGVFTWYSVVAMSAVVLISTRRITPETIPASRSAVLGTLVALVLAGTWLVLNLPYVSENLLVQRDSGFLTLQGLWMSGSSQAQIPVRTAVEVAAQVPGVHLESDAFSLVGGDHLAAQGAKAFPGLLGMAGWIAGTPGVLVANLVIGSLALLAVHDFARRLMGPVWALLPVAALAASMPFTYFTRTPFTEPVNLVLFFGGLTFAWSGVRALDSRQMAMGGGLIGAMCLSRIDGAAASVGLVLGLGVAACSTGDPQRAKAYREGLVGATVATAAMVGLGYLDLRLNSPDYLEDLTIQYQYLIAALAGSIAVSFAAVWLAGRSRVRGLLSRQQYGVAVGGAFLVVVVGLVLASRPLWLESHGLEPGSPYSLFVGFIQGAAGVPVDPTRSYDEMTLTWMSWYLGWTTVLLAFAGAAYAAFSAVRRRKVELAVVLVTMSAPTLLYLVRPSITPDQVWAMRRFLPVVLPSMVVLAAWALSELWGSRQRARKVLAAGLVVPVLLVPVSGWSQLRETSEFGGRVDEVRQLCAATGSTRVISVRGGYFPTLLPTLRIACDADVVEVREPPSAQKLSEIRAAWGGGEIRVVTQQPELLPWRGGAQPISVSRITRWEETLHPPQRPVEFVSRMFVGAVADDGSVVSLPRDPDDACPDGVCATFGPGTGLEGVIDSGWWEMEDWGVWSRAKASLTIPPGPCERDCSGVLLLRGPLPDTRVTVTRTNGPDWSTSFTTFIRGEAALPLEPGVPNRFVLEVEPTFVPSEGGQSADDRELGVGLLSVQVEGAG